MYPTVDFPIEATRKTFDIKCEMLSATERRSSRESSLWYWLYPVHGTPYLYIDVGQTRTPIKDIQRERGTSLEHIMVGTEYGMASEMTHGPAAGLRVLR